MDKIYVVIPRNCTGCRTCELACSMAKGKDGVLGHPRISIYATGKDRYMQMTCFHCVTAACMKACPVDALLRNEITRAVEVDVQRCIGCGLCAVVCPFGHIHFDHGQGLPLKCDLCGGTPVCAKFCPHSALEMR